jgi:hypothetical protein
MDKPKYWRCDGCGQKNHERRTSCLWCGVASDNPQEDIDDCIQFHNGDEP